MVQISDSVAIEGFNSKASPSLGFGLAGDNSLVDG